MPLLLLFFCVLEVLSLDFYHDSLFLCLSQVSVSGMYVLMSQLVWDRFLVSHSQPSPQQQTILKPFQLTLYMVTADSIVYNMSTSLSKEYYTIHPGAPTLPPTMINCTQTSACQSDQLTCPEGAPCTINCGGISSCQFARVTCPSGHHKCTILCTHTSTCQIMTIINTDNLEFVCCGLSSCQGANVAPTTTEC